MSKTPAYFLRPMHPKTELIPTEAALRKAFALGWVAQAKIHGHRAQVHIPAEGLEAQVLAFNRQGNLHKKALPELLVSELRRLLTPQFGWNVIDAEWLKDTDKLYLFDFLKKDGVLLSHFSFAERFALLPRVYRSECMETLGLLKSIPRCLELLATDDPKIEGLVLRSEKAVGFSDSSIVRARKKSFFNFK